ncbi:MAG: hypothetical protein Q3X03_03995, partial [Eggerthellaceae bacterium]|nr:hypothetical protein [Eggerthellaceae bacterium]
FEKNRLKEIAPGIRSGIRGQGEPCVELISAISTTKFKINSLKTETSGSETREATPLHQRR